ETSVYEVEVDLSGDADLVTVEGTAYLDGIVTVSPIDGFLLDQPYTILTADAISGAFDDVEFAQQTAFLDAYLDYVGEGEVPTDVELSIERNGVAFQTAASTANQTAVANALDGLPLSNPVTAAVALSTMEGAAAAFNQLT